MISPMSQPGYIVFAHGSSVESANEAVRSIARQAAERGELDALTRPRFWSGGRPRLAEAVSELTARGDRACHRDSVLPDIRLASPTRSAGPGRRSEAIPPGTGNRRDARRSTVIPAWSMRCSIAPDILPTGLHASPPDRVLRDRPGGPAFCLRSSRRSPARLSSRASSYPSPHSIHGKNITRAYSIASAPVGNQSVRAVPESGEGGESFSAPVRDESRATPSKCGRRWVNSYCATRIATPCSSPPVPASRRSARSCTRHLTETSPAFTLLFGVRHEHSLMYRAEFEEMARDYPHFRFPADAHASHPGVDRTHRTRAGSSWRRHRRAPRHRRVPVRPESHGG